MEEYKTCKDAYEAALKAAQASAKTLKIKRSPLVDELERQGKKLPDCSDPEIKEAFIEKMKQMKTAAEQLATAGKKRAAKPAKSLAEVLSELEASKKALE